MSTCDGFILANGDRVFLWQDQSVYQRHLFVTPYLPSPGAGLPAVYGTDRQPRVITNRLNQLPILRFDAAYRALITANTVMNMRRFTVLIVYKELTRAPAGNNGILGWRNGALGDASDDGDFNGVSPLTAGKGTNGLSFSQNNANGVKYRAGLTGT